MTRVQGISTALRSLDAAEDPITRTEARARSRFELQRVLAADASPQPVGRRRTVARAGRRMALAAGALAAVATAVVALPAITGGDQAFASWTHVPRGMTSDQRAEAVSGCRTAQLNGAGAEYPDKITSAVPVIAERRGVWSTVLLAGTGGFSALCITDDSAHLFGKGMIGSVGTPIDHRPAGRRALVATDLGVGSMDGRDISLAAGAAGHDVVGVVYHSPTHGTVTATVSHGHFALWLPGDDLRNAAGGGVRVEVRYRDGSTADVRLTL